MFMGDRELFARAVSAAGNGAAKCGIGTLGEGILHSTIKHYCQPDLTMHEVKYKGFVCDAISENGIIEIQTSSFNRLRRKLAVLLEEKDVTIVYPIFSLKYILMLDGETGEVLSRRRSPKKDTIFEVFRELYKIRSFLSNPRLSLKIISFEAEEYRLKCEKTFKNRKGYIRLERVPLDITGETYIRGAQEYRLFVPDDIPNNFDSGEFSKYAKVTRSVASKALLILTELGAIERIGKRGRSYLYSK